MKKLITIVCIVLLVLSNSPRIANVQIQTTQSYREVSYIPMPLVSGVYTTIYPDTPQGRTWQK